MGRETNGGLMQMGRKRQVGGLMQIDGYYAGGKAEEGRRAYEVGRQKKVGGFMLMEGRSR